MPLFTAGIFLLSFLALLLTGFAMILDAKIEPIEQLLTNHVTETQGKIDKLAEGQARLEDMIKEILKDRK